jgi:prepilin-type N-terminal cleavage/methylation domain-containing protein
MNRGFTLIELLVVIAMLVILATIFSSMFSGCGTPNTFEGYVTDKWTDLDGDGDKVYRCRTQSPNGEVNTWNSFWVHNDISIGQYYRFQSKMTYLSKVQLLPTPVPVSN